YREEILSHMAEAGIDGLNLSDCHIPQGLYDKADRDFFLPLEGKVHRMLKESGWNRDEIEQIQNLRQRYRPDSNTGKTDTDSMAEQESRARSLARRFESKAAESVRAAA